MVDLQPFPIGCKATLILGTITTLMVLAGRRWPEFCTAWKRVGIVALLALPLAVWSVPSIGIPVLPTVSLAVVTPADTVPANEIQYPFSNTQTEIQLDHDLRNVDWQAAYDASNLGSESASTNSLLNEPTTSEVAAIPPVDINVPAIELAAVTPAPVKTPLVEATSVPASNFLFAIVGLIAAYSFVVILLLARLGSAWRGLELLKQKSVPVADIHWLNLLTHWARVMQLRRPIELRASGDVTVPMTFGWWFPVILVPQDCLVDCDPVQREAILIHELTHISRGDFFWQILVHFTASVYWLHPLIWFVRRESEALRERLCDRLCSGHLGREVYAQALIQIAARSIHMPNAGIGIAMAQRSSLRRRLNDLSNTSTERSPRSRHTSQLLVVGTAICTLGLVVVGMLTHQLPSPVRPTTTNPVDQFETDNQDDTVQIALGDDCPMSDGVDYNQLDKDNSRLTNNQTVTETTTRVELPQVLFGYDAETRTSSFTRNYHGIIPLGERSRDVTAEQPAAVEQTGPLINDTPGPFLSSVNFLNSPVRTDVIIRLEPRVESNGATTGILFAVTTQESDELNKKTSSSPASVIYASNMGTAEQLKAQLNVEAQPVENANEADIEWPDDTNEFNAQVAATVNGEPLLNGPILDRFAGYLISMRENMLRSQNDPKLLPPGQPRPTFENYQNLRHQLIQMGVAHHVQKTILVQHLIANSTPEQLESLNQKVDDQFKKEIEKLKHELKADTVEELEFALRAKGTSLQRAKENFALERLAGESVAMNCQSAKVEESEVVEYYQAHSDKYNVPSTVDWQKISIDISPDYDGIAARKKLEEILTRLNQGESPDQIIGKTSRPSSSRNLKVNFSGSGKLQGAEVTFLKDSNQSSSTLTLASPLLDFRETFVGNTITSVDSGFYVNNSAPLSNVTIPQPAKNSAQFAEDSGAIINWTNTSGIVVQFSDGTAKTGVIDLNIDRNYKLQLNTVNTTFKSDSAVSPSSGVYAQVYEGWGGGVVAVGTNVTNSSSKSNLIYTFVDSGDGVKIEKADMASTKTPVDSTPSWRTYPAMTKGSLADTELEVQVFSVPLNRWSNVIERPNSFCVILVTGRTEERITPFEAVKDEIKELLRQERRQACARAFLKQLYSSAVIETTYQFESPVKNQNGNEREQVEKTTR